MKSRATSTTRTGKGRALLIAGVLAATTAVGYVLAPSGAAAAPAYTSIWNRSAAPSIVAAADSGSVELGTRFTSEATGSIAGLRFYKSAANTGTHTGALWDATGHRLAGLTFRQETTSGWQTAMFAAPVNVVAGRVYVASYHAPQGRYSANEWFFGTGAVTTRTLHASRGVFAYGTSTRFPTASWHNTNYWVDVLFTAHVAPPVPPTPTQTPTPAGPATTFPSAATTGPTGSLTTDAGTLRACGTVSNRDISGDLLLTCDTTLTNSRVRGRITDNGHRLVATDSTIGPDSCPSGPGPYAGITSGDFSLTRVHVQYSQADLIQVGGGGKVTITDSLIDNACYYPGDHLDSVQFYDPGARASITLRHNKIDSRARNNGSLGNGALFFADNPGSGSVFTIADNLVLGGNYTTAFYDAYRGSGVAYRVTGNTYARGTSQYGPCISNSPAFNGTDGLEFTGNVYNDGSALSSC